MWCTVPVHLTRPKCDYTLITRGQIYDTNTWYIQILLTRGHMIHTTRDHMLHITRGHMLHTTLTTRDHMIYTRWGHMTHTTLANMASHDPHNINNTGSHDTQHWQHRVTWRIQHWLIQGHMTHTQRLLTRSYMIHTTLLTRGHMTHTILADTGSHDIHNSCFLFFFIFFMVRTDRRSSANFVVRCSVQTSLLFVVE